MAGKLPSFLSGSQLVIRMGQLQVAFAQALSFSHNMSVAPVGGIGSYDFVAIEPLQYAAQGSLVITRYDVQSLIASQKPSVFTNNSAATPDRVGSTPSAIVAQGSGNSLLDPVAFNPAKLIISTTFDIDVYQRSGDESSSIQSPTLSNAPSVGNLVYTIYDCRLTDYSFGFSPGQLLQETVSFICRGVQDRTLGSLNSTIDNSEIAKNQS